VLYKINIEALTFEAILGILDHERTTPQLIEVNATISYEYEENKFIDYAHVALLITQTMQEKKFKLIEDALSFLHHQLIKTFPTIDTLELQIKKPTILDNAVVSVTL
jgi:dihydroneopterin aldolase